MSPSRDMSVCGLVIRPHEHLLLANGQEVDLTSREFEILMRLAEHPGWVLSPDQLCDTPEEVDYSPESVSVHVSRLRHKLAAAGADGVVETVRGSGYRLRHLESGEAAGGSLDSTRRNLRDGSWQLCEAVFEIERAGTEDQVEAAAEALDEARHAIYRILAE